MPTQSQLYLSTRGGSNSFSFRAAVLKGLAADGGLFIPHSIPTVSPTTLSSWSTLSFQSLAVEILSQYISQDEIPRQHLKQLVEKSYASFRVPEVAPLKELVKQEGLWVLELWHGPTYAFKDVALQFLGNLFEYFLVQENEGKTGVERDHLTVLGATSGDTGSAAIYGLRGKKDVDVFILHPHKRISPIQEAQMTTVLDANVHNLAVNGTFDDCQDIVKQIFSDESFNKNYHLGAVNSINWARILAQITYYFHSYFTLLSSLPKDTTPRVQFVVPTGNFGDILAGYYAKKMGLPIERLVVATNENDILDRFFKTGRYEKHAVFGAEALGGEEFDGVKAHEEGAKETLSPAMDILVSSNFERLLWYLARECETKEESEEGKSNEAGRVLKGWMDGVKSRGWIVVTAAVLAAAKRDFSSYRVSDKETLETIAEIYKRSEYVLDPHTAVGVHAARKLIATQSEETGLYTISLSTAHPCKFSKAVNDALEKLDGYCWDDIIPDDVRDLLVGKEQRVIYVPNAVAEAVKKVIMEQVIRT